MPPKRANPFEHLPPSSSSESEEESGSVEEELSSEEEQEPESCLSSSKKRGFNAIDNVEEFVTKEGLDFLSDEKRTLSNPHHQLVYGLSKRILSGWLSKTRADRGKNNNGGDQIDFEMESQSGAKKRLKFDTSFNSVAYMGEFVKKKGLELLDDEKMAEMEEKWKKLQLEELKLFARKLELLKQQSGMIMAPFED